MGNGSPAWMVGAVCWWNSMLSKFRSFLRRRLGNTKPYRLAAEVRKGLAAIHGMDRRVVTLTPPGPPRGTVLFSYILDGFYLQPDDPAMLKHTHYWETRQMVQTWLDLGYAVDVIHWKNQQFVPEKRYDFFIDVRMNLERIGPLLNPDCVKIMHIETAHWLFHMTAQHQRLLDVQRRRHATIGPCKVVSPNWAIEHADCATILGNDFTRSTYAYADKPFYRYQCRSLRSISGRKARTSKPAAVIFCGLAAAGWSTKAWTWFWKHLHKCPISTSRFVVR